MRKNALLFKTYSFSPQWLLLKHPVFMPYFYYHTVYRVFSQGFLCLPLQQPVFPYHIHDHIDGDLFHAFPAAATVLKSQVKARGAF
jgi:hypothetical protein